MPPSASQPDGSGTRVQRPWGWYETLARGTNYLVKRICILRGRRLSLQRHRHRCEHWVVVAGEGIVERDGRQWSVTAGGELFLPLGTLHRAAAGAADLEIIEVQRGSDLREDDIERVADDYGRVINS